MPDRRRKWARAAVSADRSIARPGSILRQAAEQGKLVSPRRLAGFLDPIAAAHGTEDGSAFAAELMQEAGLAAGAVRG